MIKQEAAVVDSLQQNGIILCKQIHSAKINEVKMPISEYVGDGLVTCLKNVKIGVYTSDCIPITYFDEYCSVIAITHNGWRGVLSDLTKNAINAMASLGARKENIRCHMGPAISTCCYEIWGDRKKTFEKKFANSVLPIIRQKGARSYLDLRVCAKISLLNEGIFEENISVDDRCTSCDLSLPSYQRSPVSGSIITSIWIE